jgi:hypothetical protein
VDVLAGAGSGNGLYVEPPTFQYTGIRGVLSGSVEEDGDAVGGEGACSPGAGANNGLGVAAGAEAGLEGGGETTEIGATVAHDEEGLVGAGEAAVGGAGAAGLGGDGEDGDAVRGEEIGDGGLLLGEREVLDGALEVFHSEELAAAGDDSDADGVDGRVEEVAAVPWGVHPGFVDLQGALALSHVFGDNAEAGSSGGGALGKFKLSWILMRYAIVSKHDMGVLGCRSDEGWIAAERSKMESSTLLVGSGLEVLLGDGGRADGGGLRGGREGGEKQKEGQNLMTHGLLDPEWMGKTWRFGWQ